MRRVFYCGEWIQSHSLHIHLLAAPDFFGCGNAIELARIAPDEVRRGLRIQALGNELMDLFGARSVHPVGVRIGGFHAAPALSRIQDMRDKLRAALPEAEALVRWAARIPMPPDDQAFVSVAMRHPTAYAIETGAIAASDGLLIEADAYDAHFAEQHEPHSTALFSTYHQQPYLVGPLARLNLNHDRLPASIQALLAETGFALPSRNIFHSLLARAVEILLVLHEAARLLDDYHDAGFALGAGHPARRRGNRLHRSAARPAVAPLRNGCRRPRGQRPHRAADQPEPGPHRGRPAAVAAQLRARPPGRRAAPALRKSHPQLRPLHFLRHPFPAAARRADVSTLRILGIGSPSGDDQAGWLTVDALLAEGVHTEGEVIIDKLDRPGAQLIGLLGGAARVILIDAMQSQDAVGRIRHFGAEDWPAYRHGLSSHGLGVLDALALARELGSLPPRLDLYGIEIGSANPGEPASKPIHAAARQLARMIAADLKLLLQT